MKIQIKNYTFNAASKTITFGDYLTMRKDSFLIITNVTSGIIIYNFADPTLLGTVSTNVLTLAYNTASMSNTDDLMIFYDDETAATNVNLANALSAILTGSENDSVLALPGLRSDAFQAPPVLVHTTSAVTVKTAVTSKKIYITDMLISTDGGLACDLTIQDNTGTPVVIDHIYLPAVATTIPIHFSTPKYTSTGKSLDVKCNTATPNIYVSAVGYTYA